MQLSIQAALLNVRNLDRSVEFYQDLVEFVCSLIADITHGAC